jgi:hypothetical protein
MTNALKTSQEKLTLKIVKLTDSVISINSDFETNEIMTEKNKFQHYNTLKSVAEVEVSFKDKEQHTTVWEYRYNYSLGTRVVQENQTTDEKDSKEDKGLEVLSEVKATFCAVYQSGGELTEEERDAFGEHNVGFNIWPFWREFVQSMCLRMDIQPIPIGFYICPKTGEKE